LGGIYQNNINHDVINTPDKEYWKTWLKYEDVREVIESKLKPVINGRTIRVKTHIYDFPLWALSIKKLQTNFPKSWKLIPEESLVCG
jgi:hypothetical protein